MSDNNTPFASVEAAFDYLAQCTTGFDFDLEFHTPTDRPKVVLSSNDPDVRIAIDPVATDLSDADDDYVITTYEHNDHWLVVYDDSDRPGARVLEADATSDTFASTAMSFERAIERASDIAGTYTDTDTAARPETNVSSSPSTEPDSDNYLTLGSESATLHFDGASRGNPGPAATGYVLDDGDYSLSGGNPLGEATNNEAEYKALIEGLETALEHDVTTLDIRGDSQLIVNQVNGDWDCNSDDLKPHYRTVRNLLADFDSWTLEHVPREDNADADSAANTALDNAA